MQQEFLEKLYREYQAYKVSILSRTKEEIYDSCYEIDAVINLYEILREKTKRMSDHELEAPLKRKDLLMELYALWLKRDDSTCGEMKMHVDSEVSNMTKGISGK